MRIANAIQTPPSVCYRSFGPPRARKTDFGSLDLDFVEPKHIIAQNGVRSAIVARCSVGELGMTGGRSIDHHFEKLVLALA